MRLRSRNSIIAILASLFLFAACSKKPEKLATLPFADDFNRAEFGEFWKGDPAWRIEEGQVFTSGTRNNALWLKLDIPDDAVIEFDARSESPVGDIKFEVYGDGKTHASGYICIFGGWKNSISAIARLDEHGSDRQEYPKKGLVKMGQTYRMKLVSKDKVLRWFVDGKRFMEFYDSEPLRGQGHNRFAFNDWEANLYFDNLKIRAATASD